MLSNLRLVKTDIRQNKINNYFDVKWAAKVI